LKVRDKMTKTVAYVSPQSSVVEAAQLMQKHNVGSIPVYDQGVVGIVTDRDIVVRNVAHGKTPKRHKSPGCYDIPGYNRNAGHGC